MAKAVFLSLPLHGHTNPSLPLVRELVARGDEVIYYSTGAFAAKIEQTGARYRPYRNAFLADIRQLPERLEELSWLFMQVTEDLLAHELDTLRAERPDYLIVDSIAPWGQWLGEALGVPVVTSVSTFAINRRVLQFAVSRGVRPKSPRLVLSKIRSIAKAVWLGRRLSRRYHVKGPGITGLVFGRSDLNIVYTSSLFQPFAETFDDRFHFVGPTVAPRETVQAPAKPALVYVSLGTLFNADAGFYRNCFDAFKDMDVAVIMSIGSNVSEASLGQPPPNFSVRILRAAAGGAPARVGIRDARRHEQRQRESLLRRAAGSDPPDERAGDGRTPGRSARRRSLSGEAGGRRPTRLRESVERVLAEDRFREQAAVVRESFHAAGGAARAADAVLTFTGRGGYIVSA